MFHLSITARLMMTALSLVPFGMSVEALRNGWISVPHRRPYTRRLEPVPFWIAELALIAVGIGMITASWLG